MRLHENKTLFKQAVRYASDQMQIPAVYIEKGANLWSNKLSCKKDIYRRNIRKP